ncbi:MAG: peptidylprolyl isomerase [Phycisphaeraceae bacterium]|nr:peptidylprolyl isomerase [Phycisphaeraceae bacterium]
MGLVINGESIKDSVIQQDAENLRPDYTKAFEEMEEEAREKQLIEWARENVIERTLLQQEANRRNIEVTSDELNAAIKQMKDTCDGPEALLAQMGCESEAELEALTESSLRTQKLAEQIRTDSPGLSEDQIKDYYQEHAEEFTIPEHIVCAHIVKHIQYPTTEAQVMESMQKAKAELDKGRPFAMVAEDYSDCPENGGSLGAIAKGQMVEEFEDIAFNLHPGETSQVFKTRFGYHICTVTDRNPARIAELKEVKEHIEKLLKDQAETDSFYAFIDDLKSKATIEEA